VACALTEAALRNVKSAIERFDTVHKAPPVGLQLQLGWLLLNSGGDEKELYSTLTTLRMRRDVNPEQTRAFQEIWSVWIRRRAEKARKDGDLKTQVAILDAGAKLLPKDKEIRDALAGALLGAGETRRAFNTYKSMLTGTPSAEEFAAAVGAAIKLNEPVGQQWLRIGLQRFPLRAAGFLQLKLFLAHLLYCLYAGIPFRVGSGNFPELAVHFLVRRQDNPFRF